MRAARAPSIRVVEFTRSFHLGGTEVQVVELLRGMPAHYDVKVAVLEESGQLLEEVWKLGHLPESFPLHGSLAKPNTSLQVARCAMWLAKHRIELVHVHDFYSSVIAVPAAKLAGAKVLIGRLDLAHWHGRARRAVLAQLTRSADHVVANAKAIRDMVINEEGVAREKVSVIHNGIDLARFDERLARGPTLPLPDTGGRPVIVQVANMNHPVKRQEDLLAAIAEVNRDGPRVHAFLIGDGPRRPQLEALARELGVRKVVHFLGRRPDVGAVYARAAIGVLCSSGEGLSNAVMEGMAAGVPMVVTRVGGNPELITHGDRGLVVPPERPVELARALEKLLDDPELGRKFGQRGRAFVERHLTLEALVRQHDLLYRRLTRGYAEELSTELAA